MIGGSKKVQAANSVSFLFPFFLGRSKETLLAEYIPQRDTTHFDSENDYQTGCRNVSHVTHNDNRQEHVQPNDPIQPTFNNDSDNDEKFE